MSSRRRNSFLGPRIERARANKGKLVYEIYLFIVYFQILQHRYGAIAEVGTQQEIIKRYKTKQLNTQVH